jgi:steroid delta-isomerase-like uncharacterized protein
MWELFNEHRLDELVDQVAEGAVNHNALEGTPDGPEGFREVFGRLFGAFPDMRFEVEDLIADGGRVACVGFMTGTNDGEYAGMPPTGKRFRARHIHVFTFDGDGKVVEHLAVRDDVEMLRQLEIVPGPPGG